jgi:hypothetical protein
LIQWTLNFDVPIWLSVPIDFKDNAVKTIQLQLGTLDTATFIDGQNFDEYGQLQEFTGDQGNCTEDCDDCLPSGKKTTTISMNP